jgi:hypothetical protein
MGYNPLSFQSDSETPQHGRLAVHKKRRHCSNCQADGVFGTMNIDARGLAAAVRISKDLV